jgi:hypothetical protein
LEPLFSFSIGAETLLTIRRKRLREQRFMARPVFKSLFVALALTASSINPVTAGVAIDDIEMVILESRFMGGMLGQAFTFHSHVLLKNGEVYRNVKAALEDLDIDALKKARSDGWGTWRRDGDAYVFT